MRIRMVVMVLVPLVFGCAVKPPSEPAPSLGAADVLNAPVLAGADSTDIVGWLRGVKPRWFVVDSGRSEPRVVVDREPLDQGARLQLALRAINQIAYFPPDAAAHFFGTADGRPIISIATTAGDSRSATALRPVRRKGPSVEKRVGLLMGWERLDRTSESAMIEGVATALLPIGLSLSLGVHQSSHGFTRSFSNGAVTESPLRLRYGFLEGRYNLRIGSDPPVIPFCGYRLFAGVYRLQVDHPLDPAPDLFEGSDIGGGFSGGLTWAASQRLAVEASATYSLFQMDVIAVGNFGYILDEPIQVDDGYLLALRIGGLLRF